MLVKVANKDTESVISALIKQSQRLPSELYRSLTWDRGKELADHQRLTLATEVEVYFCDPRSPWQRGSSENTNRLLRQYLPRGTDLSLHSQAKLSAITTRVGRIQLRGGEAESDATQNAETGMPAYRTRGGCAMCSLGSIPKFRKLAGWLRRLPAAWSALTRRSLGDQERLHPEITPHPKIVSAGPPPKT